jgi:hypothetical protein
VAAGQGALLVRLGVKGRGRPGAGRMALVIQVVLVVVLVVPEVHVRACADRAAPQDHCVRGVEPGPEDA